MHLGNYVLVEKTVPFGYISDGKPIPVTLGLDAQLKGEYLEKRVSIFNERQKVTVTLDKVMEMPEDAADDFNPYENVKFGLYARDDIKDVNGKIVIPKLGCLEEFTVDKNGKATIKTDLPFGSYYVKEIMTATGYVMDETEYDVVFDYAPDKGALIEIGAVCNQLKN